MPSLRSRLIYLALLNRHLLHGRLKRETWDWNTSVTQFRLECEKQAGLMAKLPDGIEILPFEIDGMYAEWVIPKDAMKDRMILYTIGGGYVSGSCTDHRAIVAKMAKTCGFRTLLFNHRLAPEDPFPAALMDTLAAYRWLLDTGLSPARIVIMGESAGGGLCLAALLAIRDSGLPLPAAGVALSPWTDLTLSGESHQSMRKYCLSPVGMDTVCVKYYAGDLDPCQPWISPLYGDLRGLPPILINVGEYDTLLSDSTRFAEKAHEAGVDLTLRVGKGMVHCYPLLAPLFPEATQAMDEIRDYIETHLKKVP